MNKIAIMRRYTAFKLQYCNSRMATVKNLGPASGPEGGLGFQCKSKSLMVMKQPVPNLDKPEKLQVSPAEAGLRSRYAPAFIQIRSVP